MLAVMTLISFVIAPTPGTPDTASNVALLSYWFDLPVQSQPAVDDPGFDAIFGHLAVRHQSLNHDTTDPIVGEAIPWIDSELILDVAHPRHRLGDPSRRSTLPRARDAASQGHRARLL
jgi:hypothetical protein